MAGSHPTCTTGLFQYVMYVEICIYIYVDIYIMILSLHQEIGTMIFLVDMTFGTVQYVALHVSMCDSCTTQVEAVLCKHALRNCDSMEVAVTVYVLDTEAYKGYTLDT